MFKCCGTIRRDNMTIIHGRLWSLACSTILKTSRRESEDNVCLSKEVTFGGTVIYRALQASLQRSFSEQCRITTTHRIRNADVTGIVPNWYLPHTVNVPCSLILHFVFLLLCSCSNSFFMSLSLIVATERTATLRRNVLSL